MFVSTLTYSQLVMLVIFLTKLILNLDINQKNIPIVYDCYIYYKFINMENVIRKKHLLLHFYEEFHVCRTKTN